MHKVDQNLKLGGPVFEGVNEDITVWPDAQGRTSWLGRFLDYLKAHGKTAVIDGVWSTVGSTNMDLWSFLRNDEVNVVILASDFAAEMEAMFGKDIEDSHQIHLEQWKKRSVSERVKEWLARLLQYWL